MIRKMKSALVYLTLACGLSGAVAPVQSSHALLGGILSAVGGGAVGVPLMVVGGVGTLTGLGGLAYGTSGNAASLAGGLALSAASIASMIGGILVLDGNQIADIAYAPLSAADARSAGLTAPELDAYNHELAEINAVREMVESDLNEAARPTLEKSAALWKGYARYLSPEAYGAVTKVSTSILHAVDRATGGSLSTIRRQ